MRLVLVIIFLVAQKPLSSSAILCDLFSILCDYSGSNEKSSGEVGPPPPPPPPPEDEDRCNENGDDCSENSDCCSNRCTVSKGEGTCGPRRQETCAKSKEYCSQPNDCCSFVCRKSINKCK